MTIVDSEVGSPVEDIRQEDVSSSGRMSLIAKLSSRGNDRMTGIKRFEILDKIGDGTYGSVFRSRDKRSGDIVAIKK